ncbi:MAG TPA: tetratricopeptide repeat protein [Planctomycetota bacterium]|nr:tetratricopeptide repeat protein [Planctomycetota bacterium]
MKAIFAAICGLAPFAAAMQGGSDDDSRRQAIEWNDKGIALQKDGKPREAIAAFERALALAPGDDAISKNLGSAWNDEGIRLLEKESRFDDAVSALEKACKLRPDDARVRRNRASALYRRGHDRLTKKRSDDALADFQAAAALDPESPRHPTSAAYVAFVREDYRRAENELEDVVRRFPKDAEAWSLLGETRYRKGDVARAVEAFEKAVELEPARPGLRDSLERAKKEAAVEGDFIPGNSTHFQFHFPPGRRDLGASTDLIARLLEEAYERVGLAFEFYPEARTQVLFYEVKDFASVTRADEWVGALYDGKIRVPIRDFGGQRDAFRRTILHEYTHRVVHALAGHACPTWLNEGLAQIQESASVRDAEIRLRARPDRLLTAADLRARFVGSSDAERARIAYDQSLSLANYLVEQRGMSSVTLYLKAIGGFDGDAVEEPKAFEDAFRLTFDELLQRWRGATNLPEPK